jgi:hypothetical protein
MGAGRRGASETGGRSEAEIRSLCESFKDISQRPKAEAALKDEINRDTPIPKPCLLLLMELSETAPLLIDGIIKHVSKLPDRVEFCRSLFDTFLPFSTALHFFLLCSGTEELELRWLLEQGIALGRTSGDHTLKIGEAVRQINPLLFLKSAGKNAVYSQIGLGYLMKQNDDFLNQNHDVLLGFADCEDIRILESVCELVASLDKSRLTEFDIECQLFVTLVRHGFGDVVFSFITDIKCASRFIEKLIPQVKDINPVFCVRVIVGALKFQIHHQILKVQPLRLAINCLKRGEYQLAAQCVSRLNFPAEMVAENRYLIPEICNRFEACHDMNQKSCICLILVPFATQSDVIPVKRVLDGLGEVLTHGKPNEVSRGLVLAVTLAQNTETARQLAVSGNLQSVSAFLGSSAPPQFLKTAANFVLKIAPYLRPDEEGVRRLMRAIVSLGIRNKNDANLLVILANALCDVPRGAVWDGMLKEVGVVELVNVMNGQVKDNAGIEELVTALHGRCS